MNRDELIEALLAGERSDRTAREIAELGETELEELVELVDTLERLEPGEGLPSSERFAQMRSEVVGSIRASERRTPVNQWLPIAAALGALAIGWLIGRGMAEGQDEGLLALQDVALEDLVAQEAMNSGASRFRYSNLQLREVSPDRMAIQVDVVSEVAMERPKDDPLMAEVLASSVESDPSLGTRLKAVRVAPDSPRLREALIAATLRDPNVSVRLRALERLLMVAPQSPATQDTLLMILDSEPSVAMRLAAIDGLGESYLTDDLLDRFDSDPQSGEAALLWRAQRRLQTGL